MTALRLPNERWPLTTSETIALDKPASRTSLACPYSVIACASVLFMALVCHPSTNKAIRKLTV